MDNTYRLTEGKVARRLLTFFFPMLLTSLLQQVYSVADTAIVGKGLGDAALGAVGNLSSLTLLIIGFSSGMTQGFAVIIARSFGAEDERALRRSVALSVHLSLILAVLLTAAGCLFLKPILLLLHTDPLILQDGLRYGFIIFGGLSVTIAYNLCSGILRALGDSRTPFVAIVISSAVNIALDCALILWLHTGVEGAAFATVFAQAVSVLVCMLKIRKMTVIRLTREDHRRSAPMYLDLLRNGIPMACMNSMIAVGCMIVQGYVNGCGVVYTSAYSAASKYLNLFILPAMTAGNALSAFVSQNDGAGQTDRIREGVRVGLLVALVCFVTLGAVMCFCPGALARLMLNEEETIALVVRYLRICGAALLIVNSLFIFRSCVQGLGYPLIPMCSGILEMVLRIPAIMLLLPRIGFGAIAWAEVAAWLGSLALNAVTYAIVINRRTRGQRPAAALPRT